MNQHLYIKCNQMKSLKHLPLNENSRNDATNEPVLIRRIFFSLFLSLLLPFFPLSLSLLLLYLSSSLSLLSSIASFHFLSWFIDTFNEVIITTTFFLLVLISSLSLSLLFLFLSLFIRG